MTKPIIKKPGQPGGFVPIPYPNAVRLASRRIAGIQTRHGEGAVAILAQPGARLTAALVRRIEAREVRGLVTMLFRARIDRRAAKALERLDFYLAIDTVLGPAARRADIVLPATDN